VGFFISIIIAGSELFIVDNSNENWKVLKYLRDWCQISKGIDIATGYFEIGSLLALDGEWQKVDEIRILMGDDVSRRTQNAFVEGLKQVANRLDVSIETEKLKNDFLTGVPSIVEAIYSGKIKCRVYRKEKFHAKAYVTHARLEVVGSSALVGSSNPTYPCPQARTPLSKCPRQAERFGVGARNFLPFPSFPDLSSS